MDETLSRVLAAWVDAVRRRAGAVVVAVLLATAPLFWYAATHLGVNADNTSMLSEDLPFRQLYDQFARVFPILDNALLVVGTTNPVPCPRRCG